MNQKIKRILSIALLLIVGAVSTYVYCWYQIQQEDQTDIDNLHFQEKIALLERKNEQYLAPIEALCDEPMSEVSGIDYYRCIEIDTSNNTYTGIDPASADAWAVLDAQQMLENPGLPAYCDKKISEMTSNELIECQPLDNVTDSDNPFDSATATPN